MSEMPASVRKMMDEGWEFRWEPETRFVGAYHPRGGKISVLEVRDPRFADIGAWIDAAIGNPTTEGQKK